jgi:endonuclease YncB( thermonuclease family)
LKYLLLLIALFPFPAQAQEKPQTFHEPVVLERVIDGDTIVASGKKIRLWGINTPEKGDPLFDVARMFLEALLKEGTLSCKFIEEDRYKRNVMHCLIDNSDIGSMMVQMGMAEDYESYSGGYYQAEQELAKADRRGLWKHGDARRL